MKKLLLGIITLLMSTSLFAANDFCKDLSGTWSGTYNDPTQLFAAGNFPIALQLEYSKGRVYGYTLPANDSAGGRFGANTGEYLLFGQCTHNKLSQLYFIKNTPQVCGDQSKQTLTLQSQTLISGLILPYENAMTSADLNASLTKQTQASTIDTLLLAQVRTISNGTITTCH